MDDPEAEIGVRGHRFHRIGRKWRDEGSARPFDLAQGPEPVEGLALTATGPRICADGGSLARPWRALRLKMPGCLFVLGGLRQDLLYPPAVRAGKRNEVEFGPWHPPQGGVGLQPMTLSRAEAENMD